MVRDSRRRFLQSAGVLAGAGLAGCIGGSGGDGGGGGSVTIMQPEGTVFYPFFESAIEAGIFEDEGVDLTVEYRPFPAQVQSITSGEVPTGQVSVMPYLANAGRGEDLVMYGLDGTLQIVNSLYVLADSDYHSVQDLEGQRIGVWSFGSSTVQSFQALLADRTGLRLREDFETTTAAPPALVGLLQDGQVDGIINISGISISMEAQPDTFRNIAQMNQWWIDETGFTLPLTGWFTYADWYENNTEIAAGLIRGARRAVQNFRNNTRSILQEYGEPASIDTEAKIDVVARWANAGQVYRGEATDEYDDATWQFVDLMAQQGFIEQVPDRDAVTRDPLA